MSVRFDKIGIAGRVVAERKPKPKSKTRTAKLTMQLRGERRRLLA